MCARPVDLIAADAHLQQTFELLTSIAAAGAIQLLGDLLVLPPDMSAKQWVAMAGLDPRAHESGPRPATATCALPSTCPL
ncbi:MAG: hypothetical protein [Olavius algarvensis Gamma 1 endosymbiont]|nr:MAG: hypothetical protein [Olavius algarvensis Gamma 1 endosymbiont]